MDPLLPVLLLGGAAVYLWLQQRGGSPSVLRPGSSYGSVVPPNLAGVPPLGPIPSRGSGMSTAITAGTAVAGALASTLPSSGAGAASAIGGGAAAGGAALSGAAIAATAGIAAGGVLLAWAIAQKGVFRGGWEGITGNRIRDVFFQQFIDIYYPGAGSERQFDAIVRAFGDIQEGHRAEPMIRALYQADSESEMKAATRAIADIFNAHGVPISAPSF